MDSRIFGLLLPAHAGQAILSLSQVLLAVLLATLTLPSKTWTAHSIRLGLFAWVLPKIFDYSTNKSYTLNNRLVDDLVFSLNGWYLLIRMLDVTFVTFLSPVPRWIRPTPAEFDRLLILRQGNIKDLVKQNPEMLVPKEWTIVPFPSLFSTGRLLYAIDYLTLLRPGTSPLLPWQFRAFEWSLPALKPNSSWHFGKPETSPKVALLHFLTHSMASAYWYLKAIRCIDKSCVMTT